MTTTPLAKLGIELTGKGPRDDSESTARRMLPPGNMARRSTAKSRNGAPTGFGLSDEMVVLPVQLVAPLRLKMNGVRSLMVAVLTDAVESFCKTLGARSKQKQKVHEEASTWIFSDDRSGIFSFLNLCEALDLDPAYLRDGLTRWRSTHSRERAAANPGLGPVARLLASA